MLTLICYQEISFSNDFDQYMESHFKTHFSVENIEEAHILKKILEQSHNRIKPECLLGESPTFETLESY